MFKRELDRSARRSVVPAPNRLALVLGLAAALGGGPLVAAGDSASLPSAAIERGRYLVTVTACGDCHTPFHEGPNGPEPDLSRFLSGHPEGLVMPAPPVLDGTWGWIGSATNTAFAGPWGISFAANLTSDEVTGLGAWSEEIFINALRTGKHWGQSRPILPPMPWQAFAQLTDEDLKAIFAYLRSVPAVRNQVPEPILESAPEPAF